MKKSTYIISLAALILGLSLGGYYLFNKFSDTSHKKPGLEGKLTAPITAPQTTSPQTTVPESNSPQITTPESNYPPNISDINTIKLANWNLQIFGDSKASNPELMDKYISTINNYDIVFVQEIRDSDGSAFNDLCSKLENYDCNVSSRAGRSTSKEQYGVIYKKSIKIKELKDYNPDVEDRWERPPIEVLFDVNGYELRAYNIHTKPEAVESELSSLESVVLDQGNVVILGDLNADCSYYSHEKESDFNSWNWVIGDEKDTTSSATDCTYDRIILNSDANNEYVSSGVYTNGIDKTVSDHYLIWVELRTR